jgi:hypothetical protein
MNRSDQVTHLIEEHGPMTWVQVAKFFPYLNKRQVMNALTNATRRKLLVVRRDRTSLEPGVYSIYEDDLSVGPVDTELVACTVPNSVFDLGRICMNDQHRRAA